MAGDHLDVYSDLDRRLVAATRGIRLLQSVSWPAAVEIDFVAAWKAGTARLPVIEYPRGDFTETREALTGIFLAAEPGHPLGDYIRRTAQSWRIATELLDAVGTPAITEHSAQLYGRPSDLVPGAKLTNVDAARHFIALADELVSGGALDEIAEPIEAEQLRVEMQRELDAFFGADVVRVETDPDLIAKAALDGIERAQGAVGIDVGAAEEPIAEPGLEGEEGSERPAQQDRRPKKKPARSEARSSGKGGARGDGKRPPRKPRAAQSADEGAKAQED